MFVCFFNICGTMHEKRAKKHAWIEMTRQEKILKMDAHLTIDICGKITLKYIYVPTEDNVNALGILQYHTTCLNRYLRGVFSSSFALHIL